jgi:hypothetical protein
VIKELTNITTNTPLVSTRLVPINSAKVETSLYEKLIFPQFELNVEIQHLAKI